MPVNAEAKRKNYVLALDDLVSGIMNFRMWAFLAWQEIRARYKRSVIGPFWLTLNMAIMVVAMGPLYSALFRQPLEAYYIYLSSSVVIWGLISALINEGCTTFIGAEGFIKQIKLPFSIFVLKYVWKNLIIFAHNFIVVIVVFIFFTPPFGWGILLFPVGLIIVGLNSVWVGIVLGILCTRFRDIPQIVSSLVGVAFFVTPIMWQASMAGNKAWLLKLNPLYHFIEILRSPLIDHTVNYEAFAVSIIITLAGYIFMFALFARYRARIAYWL